MLFAIPSNHETSPKNTFYFHNQVITAYNLMLQVDTNLLSDDTGEAGELRDGKIFLHFGFSR